MTRERRQTRSVTASSANNSTSNSSVDSSNECTTKRKLSVKEESELVDESSQIRKSQRRSAKSQPPNENEMNTIKPKISKKENKLENVLNSKNVNNNQDNVIIASTSTVSSSASSTSSVSDTPRNTSSTDNKISTRRRSSNYLGHQLSSSSSLIEQSQSPLSRKRNLSTSVDLTKGEILNENDPCSQSAQASSSSALTQSASSSSLHNKRLKLKHKYAFKELNENTNLQTTFRLMSKDEYDQNSPFTDREEAGLSEINETEEFKDEDNTKESLVCPVLGCKSEGHLDGMSEHHYSYDTCPIYFFMSREDCQNRHSDIDKRLSEIKEKINRINESKKCLRNKVFILYSILFLKLT